MSEGADPSATRASLLLRIRDPKDAAAWQTFAATYAPLVYRWCRGRGLQDADAADVTQEVLAEVARCIRTFEYQPERGRFRGWLGALTWRQLGHFLQRQGRDAAPGGLTGAELTQEDVEGEWAAEFNAHLLRVALDRVRTHFEPLTWRAFEGAWLEGRPAAGVAGDLGVPIEAVYVAKSRVLKRLEEEVLALADDLPQCVPLRQKR